MNLGEMLTSRVHVGFPHVGLGIVNLPKWMGCQPPSKHPKIDSWDPPFSNCSISNGSQFSGYISQYIPMNIPMMLGIKIPTCLGWSHNTSNHLWDLFLAGEAMPVQRQSHGTIFRRALAAEHGWNWDITSKTKWKWIFIHIYNISIYEYSMMKFG